MVFKSVHAVNSDHILNGSETVVSVLFTKNVRVECTMNKKLSTELKIFLRPQKRVVRSYYKIFLC